MTSIPSEQATRNAVVLLAEAAFDPGISVDGLVPGGVVRPGSAEEMAAVLAVCREYKFSAAPVGGGTKLSLGNVPEKLDVAISTLGLGGVLAYEPIDLVCSVGAGARFGDVQAVLAEHGQTLPIDAPGGDESTIGGLIATALAGPRRLGNGTLRDLLIGIAVAHPSGTVTHSGGMVVKNVSGFDLPRVYHGSLGTLGIIVSANFKVLPLPRREATVLGAFETLPASLDAATRMRQSRISPVALDVMKSGSGWGIAVRITGQDANIDSLIGEAERTIGGDCWIMEGQDSVGWWREYTATTELSAERDGALIRLTIRARDVETLALGAVSALEQLHIPAPVVAISPGLGQVLVRIAPGGVDARDKFLAARDILGALCDHCIVLASPPDWKRGIDVWGPAPPTLEVMQAIKDQFDPDRVLNPGRFAGFI